MALIDRVKAILLSPKTEWPAIAAEATDIPKIYSGYLVLLAAIPAVAGFIGMSLVGVGAFGYSMRVPVLSGLASAVVQYVMVLGMSYVLALIANALAPTFGGQPDLVRAFKLVAYGSTAALVGGIFSMIPALGVLGLLAALYSLYLLFLGVPVLMRCPEEKAVPYTAVLVVCAIVVGVVMGSLLALFRPGPAHFGDAGTGGEVAINTPNGEVRIDTAKMAEAAKRMEAATKQAQASSDPAAAGRAVAEAMSAMTGAAGGRTPIPVDQLKAALPQALGDLERKSFESNSGAPMGIQASTASARYAAGDASVKLEITDTGGLAGVMSMAGWMSMTGEKEDENGSEKVYKDGGRTVREQLHKGSKRAEYDLVLANGVIVSTEGDGVAIDKLKSVVAALDLAKLESWKGK